MRSGRRGQAGRNRWAIVGALAVAATAGCPATGDTTNDYGVSMVDSSSPVDRQQAYDALEVAGRDGRPSAVYVGDGTSPRHVVLVVGAGDGTLTVYEPWDGRTVTVTEEQFVSGDVDLAGWERPWAVVTP